MCEKLPGFVISFAYVTILWKSPLQTGTALSTMEAKIIALSACCRELFPIINMVESVTHQVNQSTNWRDYHEALSP